MALRDTVLIITNPCDPHTDAVIHFLYKMNVDVIRFHAAECHFDSNININNDSSFIEIISSGRSFNIKNISSVWYRRPDTVEEHVKQVKNPDKHLVVQETNAVLWGLYGQIDAIWYSHPYNIRKAAWKLYQLTVAKKIGFNCPPYLISNNQDLLFKFASSYNEIVMKPIDEKTTCYEIDGIPYSLYVKKFNSNELKDLFVEKPISPILLQKYINKKYDVRITVIGQKLYTVAILPLDHQEIVDFRPFTLELKHQVVDCPTKIQELILTYMKIMGLNFAAFDFVVDHKEEWYFLECNPNGQWLWIEIKTELPMAKSFARHLALKEKYLLKGSHLD